MTRLVGLSMVLVLALAGLAHGQSHGLPDPEQQRTPGIRPDTLEAVFVGALEQAHQAEAWAKHDAVEFELKLSLDDQPVRRISATFDTTSGARILKLDGQPLLGHDGEKAWERPEVESLGDAEVHVRMLGQLPAFVYRLRESDLILHTTPPREIGDRRYFATSLEQAGSEDWRIVLADPHTNLLHAVAYYIGVDEEDEPAFSPAHAMIAGDYKPLDGVPVARSWSIWRWSRPRGPVGDGPIGKVEVASVRFIEAAAERFAATGDDDDDT